MSRKFLLAVAIAAITFGGVVNQANASLVGGGPVDSTVFTAAGLGTSGWSYESGGVSAFAGAATGTLELSLADYNDTFGVSNTSKTSSRVIFTETQANGTAASINSSYSPYLLYLSSPGGEDDGSPADTSATLYSNGSSNGTDGGQAGLAVYHDNSSQEYAFFFDDGGPSGETCSGTTYSRTCHGVENPKLRQRLQ
jgi:hypothetical protein